MREYYRSILRMLFANELRDTRKRLHLTQEEMSEMLMMSERSYNDLENSRYCCGGLTLVLFLTDVSSDPMIFLKNLREAFKSYEDNML